MKFNVTFKLFDKVLSGMIKNDVKDKNVRKNISKEYRDIVERAGDIGANNNLLSSYALCAYFIAMNRKDGLTADENIDILDKNMRESKLLKIFMGGAKGYFSEEHMAKRRAWSKLTHEKKYKNDWVVDVIEKSDDFEFGLDYTECGVCKLCKDENCFELAKYLCRLDFMLVEIIGIHLKRTMTLADGCPKCDFRFVK